MSVTYSHDQFGKLFVTMIVPVIALLAALFPVIGQTIVLSVMVVAFVLLILLFYTLSVEVTRDHLRLRFGIGLVSKTFDTGEMVDVYPVRNKWYYGFGIRLTPHGWLFNVSGLDAVEIVMRSGRHYRIGTDEPQALAAAVKRAIDDSAHQA